MSNIFTTLKLETYRNQREFHFDSFLLVFLCLGANIMVPNLLTCKTVNGIYRKLWICLLYNFVNLVLIQIVNFATDWVLVYLHTFEWAICQMFWTCYFCCFWMVLFYTHDCCINFSFLSGHFQNFSDAPNFANLHTHKISWTPLLA